MHIIEGLTHLPLRDVPAILSRRSRCSLGLLVLPPLTVGILAPAVMLLLRGRHLEASLSDHSLKVEFVYNFSLHLHSRLNF